MLSSLVNKALSAFINSKLGEAGKVASLDLDKNSRSIRLSIDFSGEAEHVAVMLKGYRLVEEGEETSLAFDDVTISRQWMESLLKSYKPELSFRIPSSYKQAVRMALG